ncbi:glutathione S-transferase family protein [Alteromonas lipolytica]|uniref:Glutathione S-transferase n=1 Tax=Alteromonas lipolytica TaxID=1856405 RepID=A0A1E8FAG0_9ALTE|nr:glutathione S-transferase family protein [Alteromonas lipolytica]OFI32901.1 glutathione S-transferase [Alteromonas lipolytica]GGF64346.1 glutathione S-transferase [Alteromonas lipolytica]
MKVYGDSRSGNCYKIQLLLGLLGKQCEWIEIDILAGETQTEAFKARNPVGKIPLLELSDGRCLSESNAILNYLAAGSSLIPNTEFELAKMLQWQFFEQYSHEPAIAVARFINVYLGLPADRKQEYQQKQEAGHKALAVMEHQLLQTLYLVGNQMTLADISLYAYTHVAHEAGISLDGYPAIKRWLSMVADQRGYMPMQVKS